MYHFCAGIVIMLHCDNLGPAGGRDRDPAAPSARKHHRRNGTHENQRHPARKRTRPPARPVSRGRELGDLSGSHPRQRRELDHDPQLRLQRRRRPVRFHLRLYRLLRLCPDDAGPRLHRRRHAADQARLAALCRPHHPVRDLHRLDQLSGAAVRRFRTGQRVQRRRPGRQCDRDAAAGPVPEVQAGQSRRAAALHRADGAVPAGAVDHAAPAQLDHDRLDRAVAGVAADRLEPAAPIRPGTWYFNPFAWQVLFVFGAWCALGGARQESWRIINSPVTLYFCIAYLLLRAGHDHGRQVSGLSATCSRIGCIRPSTRTTRPTWRPTASCISSSS